MVIGAGSALLSPSAFVPIESSVVAALGVLEASYEPVVAVAAFERIEFVVSVGPVGPVFVAWSCDQIVA
jgi:hypothetical protein